MIDHVGTQIVADAVGVPAVGVEQPLHPIRGGLTALLGQLPPVLALSFREQTPHIGLRPLPRPPLQEPPTDAGEHLFEPGLPARQVYAICGGCRAPSEWHNPKGAAAVSAHALSPRSAAVVLAAGPLRFSSRLFRGEPALSFIVRPLAHDETG